MHGVANEVLGKGQKGKEERRYPKSITKSHFFSEEFLGPPGLLEGWSGVEA